MNYKNLLKSKKYKIAVWGTGYIGLSTMVYFAKPDSKKNPVQELSANTIAASVPLSPKRYRDAQTATVAIESILNTARVPRTKGDINEFRAFTRRPRD